MANAFYNYAKTYLMNGAVDLDTDTIHVALVTSAYTPNIDTHDFFNDVTNEVTGTGYTAGGQALASKTVTVDTTNDRGVFDSADPSWTTATITARAAVLYKKRGGASSADELIGYWDFGADIVSTAGTFTIAVNANGWFYIG
jgi:hypothetical protein